MPPQISSGSAGLLGDKSIKYRHLDYNGLPFEGELVFEKPLDQNPEYLRISDRLKPKDFLYINGFYIDGKKIAPAPSSNISS